MQIDRWRWRYKYRDTDADSFGAQHIQQRISNALREQALQDLLRRVVTALSHDLLFHR